VFYRLVGCQGLFEDALLLAVTKRESLGTSSESKYRTLGGKNGFSSQYKILIFFIKIDF